MPKIAYEECKMTPATLAVVRQANQILAEYAARGITVTLRQLYYQFVARDLIQNKQSEYKRLGDIINNGRLAGLIDWNHLQDRTRNLARLSHWSEPGGIIESAARSYHRNLWEGQAAYVEVWIEKDALVGVIEDVCERWDVPFFSCRGYTSQSEMWSAGQRLLSHVRDGRRVHIIHLGDHDPSGRDMSRDIEDRLHLFVSTHLVREWIETHGTPSTKAARERYARSTAERLPNIHRIALNIDQVRQYNPPPNPAKLTDTRSTAYIDEFGPESWELDALDPDVLVNLIERSILDHLDRDQWQEQQDQQETEREILTLASQRWEAVSEFLNGGAETE